MITRPASSLSGPANVESVSNSTFKIGQLVPSALTSTSKTSKQAKTIGGDFAKGRGDVGVGPFRIVKDCLHPRDQCIFFLFTSNSLRDFSIGPKGLFAIDVCEDFKPVPGSELMNRIVESSITWDSPSMEALRLSLLREVMQTGPLKHNIHSGQPHPGLGFLRQGDPEYVNRLGATVEAESKRSGRDKDILLKKALRLGRPSADQTFVILNGMTQESYRSSSSPRDDMTSRIFRRVLSQDLQLSQRHLHPFLACMKGLRDEGLMLEGLIAFVQAFCVPNIKFTKKDFIILLDCLQRFPPVYQHACVFWIEDNGCVRKVAMNQRDVLQRYGGPLLKQLEKNNIVDDGDIIDRIFEITLTDTIDQSSENLFKQAIDLFGDRMDRDRLLALLTRATEIEWRIEGGNCFQLIKKYGDLFGKKHISRLSFIRGLVDPKERSRLGLEPSPKLTDARNQREFSGLIKLYVEKGCGYECDESERKYINTCISTYLNKLQVKKIPRGPFKNKIIKWCRIMDTISIDVSHDRAFVSAWLDIVKDKGILSYKKVFCLMNLFNDNISLTQDHLSHIFEVVDSLGEDPQSHSLYRLCIEKALEIGLANLTEGQFKDRVVTFLHREKRLNVHNARAASKAKRMNSDFILWVFKSTIRDERLGSTPFTDIVMHANGLFNETVIREMLEFAENKITDSQEGGGNFVPILAHCGSYFKGELMSKLLTIVQTKFHDPFQGRFLQSLLENNDIIFDQEHISQMRDITKMVRDSGQKQEIKRLCNTRANTRS